MTMSKQTARNQCVGKKGSVASAVSWEHQEGGVVERRRFDGLLLSLSNRIKNASSRDLEMEINDGLKDVVAYFGVDRISLWEFTGDGKEAGLKYFFSTPGAEPPRETVRHDLIPYVFEKLNKSEMVEVSRLEDLPAAAEADRQYLHELGIKSFLIIPLIVGGIHRGALSLAVMRTKYAWTDVDIVQVQRIGTVIANGLDRKIAHHLLEERIRFETLISDISARFVNLPHEMVDREINDALRRVLELFKVEYCVLFEINKEEGSACVNHISYAPGVLPLPEHVDVRGLYPGAYDLLVRQGKHICKTKLEDVKGEVDRANNRAMGFEAAINIPIPSVHPLMYVITLATREKRNWSEEFIPRLRQLGGIFVGALIRKRTETILRESEELNSAVLASLNDHVVILDRDGRIIEGNEAWERFVRGNGGALGSTPRGTKYMGVCRCSVLDGDPFAQTALDGIHSVLDGSRELFSLEYPCHCSTEERWFLMRVLPLKREEGGVVISHGNITERKKNEASLQQAYTEIQRLKEQLEAENSFLRKEMLQEQGIADIVGDSEAIKVTFQQVAQVAPTDSTVLVQGETGTGKELVAQAIHNTSRRRDKLMVKVNCASLPSALIESELFGREKGAYTGALTKQAGRFDIAHGSTIFLDEIGELSLELQSKLLRVLQEGTFERLGSPKTIHVDVRVIAATNRNLAEEVKKGTFREDLFYRLNVFPIHVPPLRERIGDIPALVWAFVNEFTDKMGKKINKITKRDMENLQRYAWPGNVRELRNVIEHAVIVSSTDTLNVRLPDNGKPESKAVMTLEETESSHIRNILQLTGWRIKGEGGAAQLLGMNPSTLYSRMLKLGISTRQ